MPLYRYRAVDEAGEIVEGEMEASAREQVIERLRAQGQLPLKAEEAAPGGIRALLSRDLMGTARVSRRDVVMLTRELATLLEAGTELERALEILADLTPGEKARRLILVLLERIRSGSSLADALAAQGGVFPRSYVGMVRAGESGGRLETVLAQLSDHMEKSETLKAELRTALIYPILLLVMAGLSVLILLMVVVPQFRPLFDDAGAALPLATQVVVALGDGLRDYGWIGAIVVALGGLVLYRQWRDPQARIPLDRLLLALPILGGLVQRVEAARFARTLGMLLENGVPMLKSISIVRDGIGNRAMFEATAGVGEGLKQGRGLAVQLAKTGMFPALMVKLLKVGEESGRLEEMLLKLAEIFDMEVARAIKRAMALLAPALTIFLGLIVAGIIGSIMAAVLSIYDLPI